MSAAGTIEILAGVLADALSVLERRLAAAEVDGYFADLGLRLPTSVNAQPGLSNALQSTSQLAGQLPALVTSLSNAIKAGDVPAILAQGATTLARLVDVFNKLDSIGTQLNAVSGAFAGVPAADVSAFAQRLPAAILERALVEHFERVASDATNILAIAGIIDRRNDPGDPSNAAKVPHRVKALKLNRLPNLLRSPLPYFQNLYGWGNPGFNGQFLIAQIAEFANSLGLPALVNPGGGVPSVDLLLLEISLDNSATPPGLKIELRVPVKQDFANRIPLLRDGWFGEVKVGGRFDPGFTAHIRPPSDFSLKPSSGTFSGSVGAGVSMEPTSGAAFTLLGLAGASRIEAKKVVIGVRLDTSWDAGSGTAKGEPGVSIEISDAKLVLDVGGGDSFISMLTGGGQKEVNLSLGATFSPKQGLRFLGSSAMEVAVPAHLAIGPVKIETLYISLGIDSGGIPLELSASMSSTLGPLGVVIDRIGLRGNITFPDKNGNLGPLNIGFGFKPPTGVGLTLDAGGFKGGGFLMLDIEKGEYAGALELDFQGLCSVKAIAIINTKMPNGAQGFSLLIVIAAEFIPIQLGFGFTLNGVGGIFGLNRKINVSALADGIRTNAIKSILFPENIVANIVRIISDIKQFFPPEPDHFVVGPMAKLGWGTPSIVTVELGLLLDLPDPMFAIVGVLKCMLPAEEFALLRFQVNFIGVVDFGHGYIFFRADLFDSRLLFFALTGSLAFLVSWGEAQTFAISVGGFHPDFHDIPSIPALPNGFRGMARVGISLLSDDNPRLKIESYFAVTSNSVQFGSKVELYAGAGGFNVYGYLGFDVLFQFSPFRFDARLYGGIALRIDTAVIAGITIEARLAGPTPWDVRGEACLTILFIEICVGFHVTWGDDPPAIPAATEDLMKLLLKEYADSRNWKAELPPNNHLHVTLKKIEEVPNTDTLVIHPAGVLTFSQRSLPLEDYLIQKFGAKKPLAENKFKLSNANSDGMPIGANFSDVREVFAPGNFSALSDSDKLSRHSFERLPSGFRLSATSDLVTAFAVQRPVDYELSYLRQKQLVFKGLVKMALVAYNKLVRGSAVRQSSLSKQQSRVSMNAPPPAELPKEAFTIASTMDLKPHLKDSSGVVFFGSQTEAYQRQQELLASDPNLVGSIQVVSHFELNPN